MSILCASGALETCPGLSFQVQGQESLSLFSPPKSPKESGGLARDGVERRPWWLLRTSWNWSSSEEVFFFLPLLLSPTSSSTSLPSNLTLICLFSHFLFLASCLPVPFNPLLAQRAGQAALFLSPGRGEVSGLTPHGLAGWSYGNGILVS